MNAPLNPAEIAGLSFAYGATFDDRKQLGIALRVDRDTYQWLIFDADVPTVQAIRAIYVMNGATMRDASIPDAEPAAFRTDLRIDAFGQAYHAPAAESALLHTAPVHGPYCAIDGSCDGCSCKACDGPLSADEARRGALCPMCEVNYR